MEEKQAASSASPRVLMQPYPRLVSWEQYKENVVSPSPARPSLRLSTCHSPMQTHLFPPQNVLLSSASFSSCFSVRLPTSAPPSARDWGKNRAVTPDAMPDRCRGTLINFSFGIYYSVGVITHFQVTLKSRSTGIFFC